jgi:hypothetical protein
MIHAAILLTIEKDLVIRRDEDGTETILHEKPPLLTPVSEECTEQAVEATTSKKRGRPQKNIEPKEK